MGGCPPAAGRCRNPGGGDPPRLDDFARDRHERAGGPVGGTGPPVTRRVAAPIAPRAPRVAESRPEALAGEPDALVRLVEEELAREDPGARPSRRGGAQRDDRVRFERRIVVDEHHPPRAPLERMPDPGVVAAREAEVALVLDEVDVREALADRLGRAVAG